jgi:hypothetical protein
VSELNPLVKAAFRAARPEVIDGRLVLWFDSKIVSEKAQQYPHAIEGQVTEWLGDGRVEYRMAEGQPVAAGPAARPVAPEEHETVQRAVRQLEGRVTQVSRPKETKP